MKKLAGIYKIAALLAVITLLLPSDAFGRKWLITNHDQITTNPIPKDYTPERIKQSDINRIGLTDGDPVKDDAISEKEREIGGNVKQPWRSVDDASKPEDPNILIVKLNEPLTSETLAEGDSLVFYLKRHTLSAREHPLAIRVGISADGKEFTPYKIIYFLYRGFFQKDDEEESDTKDIRGTKEYSARVDFKQGVEMLKDKGGVKYIRLTVLTNNTKTRVTAADGKPTEKRTMRLAAFNIMQLAAGENYSDILIDRFHLVTDYSYKYYYYDFVPTLGIFESRNRYNSDGKYHNQLKDYITFPGEGDSPWEEYNDATGSGYRWKHDLDVLKAAGVTMNTFTRQTHAQDSRVADIKNVPGTKTENWRQPAHETEHVIYAMPGDPVALYPFYGMADLDFIKYNINFVHWYDYRTGGSNPYLDFLINPSLVAKSRNYGYFVGTEITEFTKYDPDPDPDDSDPDDSGSGGDTPVTPSVVEITTVDEYKAFVERVNNGESGLNAKLMNDLDFSGHTNIDPIGKGSKDQYNAENEPAFKGTFNGQGYKISNLIIDTSNSDYIISGMFGCVKEGTQISNIFLDESCKFIGKNYAGVVGIASDWNNQITISNVVSFASNKTTKTGEWDGYTGGIVGKARNVKIENCYFGGAIEGGKQSGAIAGKVSDKQLNLTNSIIIPREIKTYYTTSRWEWDGSQNVEIVTTIDITLDSYLANSDADKIQVTNVYSPLFTDNDITKGVIKLEGTDGNYTLTKDGKTISVNSQEFAKELGDDEWVWDSEWNALVPFVKIRKKLNPEPEPEPGPGDEPVEKVDYDAIPHLKKLLNKIYDNPSKTDYFGKKPAEIVGSGDHHKIGTAATFFTPRSRDVSWDQSLSLPEDPNGTGEDKDILIAADLSTIFINDENYNVANNDEKIYEPTVLFRHIFRIKDGRTFAEEFSGSPENNKEYVRKNRRIISGSVNNKQLRIRLDYPAPYVPEGQNSFAPPSNLYYKISDSDYRRVRSFEIEAKEIWPDGTEHDTKYETTNQWGGTEIKDPIQFYFEEPTIYVPASEPSLLYRGVGKRMLEDTYYYLCSGGGYYSRMLYCEYKGYNGTVKGKKYVVRLYALDINNKRIKIYDPVKKGPGDVDLVVQQFDLDFIDTKFNELNDGNTDGDIYSGNDPVKTYGAPVATIDFDQYSRLTYDPEGIKGVKNLKEYFGSMNDENFNSGKFFYKWPVAWKNSTYGFAPTMFMYKGDCKNYSNHHPIERYDYNYDIYTLANNSSQTPWHDVPQDKKHDITYYMDKSNGADDNTARKGFFFWVNSASDPCIAATLRLGNICSGASIHVSAWMMEFSDGTERGNLSFNFMAVTDKGDKIQIHTYNTGNLTYSGKWYNIQYSFLPDYSRINKILQDGNAIDHYEILLENNCKNSEKADYAIDEVQLFVTQPEIKAEILEAVCEKETEATLVKVSIPFNQLLASIGMSEATSETDKATTATAYYAFFDKDVFDKEIVKSDYETAYDKSLLRYAYDTGKKLENGEPDPNQTYGKIYFTNYFGEADLPENVTKDNIEIGKTYREKTKDGNKNLVIFIEPRKNWFSPGQEYYVGMVFDDGGMVNDPGAMEFDLANMCANKSTFKIEGAHITEIKPDKNDQYTPGDGEYCLGSQPTVKIDIRKINEAGTDDKFINLDEKTASCDWYAGSLKEFEAEKMDDGTTTLHEVLAKFRALNPETTKETMNEAKTDASFTEDMKEYLKGLLDKRHFDGRPMLRLNMTEYNYAPGKLIATATDSVNHVIAVPFYKKELEEHHVFCDAPIEVAMKVSPKSPGMFHGLDIEYPDEIIDVPIRMGLHQIKAAIDNDHRLRVPVLRVSTPSQLATKLKLRDIRESVGAPIYLLESNDPEYSGRVFSDDKLSDDELFLKVGHVDQLEAKKTDDGPIDGNAFYVKFDAVDNTGDPDAVGNGSKPFEFHEGYYYTMKFDIMETNDADNLEINACPGQHIFTIKVVPEYLVWNGKSAATGSTSAEAAGESTSGNYSQSLNWNNDLNWKRITVNEAKPGSEYSVPTDDNTQSAFAPLDFTKVIIGSKYDFPRLYHIEDKTVGNADLPDHGWSRLPDLAGDNFQGKHHDVASQPNQPGNDAGNPTPRIQYDLVAYDKDIPTSYEKVVVSCRPWYANTAKEVNFRPNSEIYAQQHLRYEKAWVEMEMARDSWYTVASPLQGVVAGDMYLPKKGARENGTFFTDINFDNTLVNNDRFRPAVYQRSWNLATDNIYEVDGSNRNGFVKIDWSNVYNDVQVAYSPAEGFSIKSDVTEAEAVGQGDKVLFRLPKADTKYTYYDYDKTSYGLTHDVTRENPGKLNPVEGKVTVTANGTSQYFLVGNPFMAHLDMVSFLQKNKDKIDPKYWILNSNRQKVTIVDADGYAVSSDGTIEEHPLLPPLAGFFVKATDTTEELTLDFNADMMVVNNPKGADTDWIEMLPEETTRAEGDDGMMLVKATANGRTSTALIADSSIEEAGNAELVVDPELGLPAVVYTVAAGKALAINTASELDGTEIGVAADSNREITLHFSGELSDGGYYLSDMDTHTSTRIYDGMEYRLKGTASGRLFITEDPLGDIASGLEVSVSGGEVTVRTSSGDPLDVEFFDVAGRVIKAVKGASEEVRFRPGKGVVIVKATDGNAYACKTIII